MKAALGCEWRVMESGEVWLVDEEGVPIAEGFSAVRAPWRLYVEALDCRGIATMVWCVLQYSFGQGESGGCAKHAQVTLLPGGAVRVDDDGVGLPVVDLQSSWELAFVGRNASRLPGSDLFVVNAFSDKLVVETARDGRLWRQEFHGDEWWSDLSDVGEAGGWGFSVTFWPRSEFGADWDGRVVADRVEAYSQRFSGVSVKVVDERRDDHQVLLEYHN